MSKPGKVLRTLCKRLGVRLTVKRGKKRIYKSVAVLKDQCNRKKKKKVIKKRKAVKKKNKVRRKFGSNYWKTKSYLERKIPMYMSNLKTAVLFPKAAYRLWNKKKKKKASKQKKRKTVKRRRKFGEPISLRKNRERRAKMRKEKGLYYVPQGNFLYDEQGVKKIKNYIRQRQRLREEKDFDGLEKFIEKRLKEYRNRDRYTKISRGPVNVNKGISKEVKAVDPDSFKYEVEGSKPGSKYSIDLLHMACTCGDFRFRRSDKLKDDPSRLCKHIDQIFRQKGITQQQWCEHVGKEGSVPPEVMNSLLRLTTFGKKKEKISASLKKLCKKHKVRLTVKRGKKRVYKSVKVLKEQCQRKVKRKRKFGTETTNASIIKEEDFHNKFITPLLDYGITTIEEKKAENEIIKKNKKILMEEIGKIIKPFLDIDDDTLKKYYKSYKFKDENYKQQVKDVGELYDKKSLFNIIASLEENKENEDFIGFLIKTTKKALKYFKAKAAKYGSKKVKRKVKRQ